MLYEQNTKHWLAEENLKQEQTRGKGLRRQGGEENVLRDFPPFLYHLIQFSKKADNCKRITIKPKTQKKKKRISPSQQGNLLQERLNLTFKEPFNQKLSYYLKISAPRSIKKPELTNLRR